MGGAEGLEERAEAYVARLAHMGSKRAAREASETLRLFIHYANHRGYNNFAHLPWWEYSLALEWLGARGVPLTLGRARRVLGTLHDFYRTLTRSGELSDCRELEQARVVLCGGRALRLVSRPPFTGSEPWTVLRGPDGRRVVFTIADLWLCLLWRHCGESWRVLARRIGPSCAQRRQALRGLRSRLRAVRLDDPARLLSESTTTTDLEEALRWLEAPATARADPPSPREWKLTALRTAALIERLFASSVHMPRQEMQELIRRREAAAPMLTTWLRRHRASQGGDPLWALVVLGRVGAVDAVCEIGALLASEDGDLAVAASEALGSIGAPALPWLMSRLRQGTRRERLYAYGALALVPTEAARNTLKEFLRRDHHLADVIAHSLAIHGCRDAVELLHVALAFVPTPMQRELERAIFSLIHRPRRPEPVECDWRLRYRRLPRLSWRLPSTWLSIAAQTPRHGVMRVGARPTRAPRSLATILADERLRADGRRCPRCGGSIWRPTGLPVCRHTAQGVMALQRVLIERWSAAGMSDAWAALDACDAADMASAGSGEIPPEGDVTALERATLYWLVAAGHEHLRAGARHLRLIARDLAAV